MNLNAPPPTCFKTFDRTLNKIIKIFFFNLNLNIKIIAFIGPCIETMGLFFSRIHVVNSQGPPPRTLDQMDGDENQNRVKNFK